MIYRELGVRPKHEDPGMREALAMAHTAGKTEKEVLDACRGALGTFDAASYSIRRFIPAIKQSANGLGSNPWSRVVAEKWGEKVPAVHHVFKHIVESGKVAETTEEDFEKLQAALTKRWPHVEGLRVLSIELRKSQRGYLKKQGMAHVE